MKLENVEVGMKVKVKRKQKKHVCPFWQGSLNREGVVIKVRDTDVFVEFAPEYIDFGHHDNLKRVKD